MDDEFSLRIIGFSRWFFQRSARSTFNFEAKMKVAYGNKGTRPAALQECDDDICGVPHVLHQPHCMAVLLLRTRALAAHSCFLHGCRTPLLKPSFWHLMGTIPRTLTFRAIIVVLFSTCQQNRVASWSRLAKVIEEEFLTLCSCHPREHRKYLRVVQRIVRPPAPGSASGVRARATSCFAEAAMTRSSLKASWILFARLSRVPTELLHFSANPFTPFSLLTGA